MNIQTTDAQGLFTKKLVDAYKEKIAPTNFLETFFPTGPTDITDTLEVSIYVQRTSERVAVDVVRGSDGNRNEFSNANEKLFIPPYFREYFDQNSMSVFESAWRAAWISGNAFARLVNDLADHAMECQAKIERAYEIQRAQILDTGIMTFDKGTGKIDFKRKAASKVDLTGAGGYWSTNNNIYTQIQAGCEWLRKNGKVTGQVFNMICGDLAIRDLYANTVFKANQNLFNYKPDSLVEPRMNAQGGVYFGTLTAGPYRVDVWSYPSYYENASASMVEIFNPRIAVLLPPKPRFKTAYGLVPQLTNPGEAPKTGKFLLSEYTDQKARTREFHVESAGCPIPVAVDQIYTMKAVAG